MGSATATPELDLDVEEKPDIKPTPLTTRLASWFFLCINPPVMAPEFMQPVE